MERGKWEQGAETERERRGLLSPKTNLLGFLYVVLFKPDKIPSQK